MNPRKLGSFKVKLVAYFLLLSLLPMAAAFWGFTAVAGQSETRRVDARLQAGLRAALATYQERLGGAPREAAPLPRRRDFQVEVSQRNPPQIVFDLRDADNGSVTAGGGVQF